MYIDSFENNDFKAYVEDGIFHIEYKTSNFTIEVIQKALQVRLNFSKGIPLPMLADIRSIKSTQVEARKFIADPETNKFLAAGALLVENQFQKVVGNLFILFGKPNVPAKIFTDKTDAIEWLMKYK